MRSLLAKHQGSTLIEILVTIVVVSIGLLGIAALQLKSVAVNQSAYQRLQATNIASEIADSLSINPLEAENGAYTLTLANEAPAPQFLEPPSVTDIRRWYTMLNDRLPSGDLIITPAAGFIPNTDNRAREYTITICWYDKNNDDTDASCGVDQASFVFVTSVRS